MDKTSAKMHLGAVVCLSLLICAYATQPSPPALTKLRQWAAQNPVTPKTIPAVGSAGEPGTYWSIATDGSPMPFDPFPELQVFTISMEEHVYAIDDRSVDYDGLHAQQAQDGQDQTFSLTQSSVQKLDPGGVSGLHLNIESLGNGWLGLGIYNATNDVYAVWAAHSRSGPWRVIGEAWPTNAQYSQQMVWTHGDTFVTLEDWTGVTHGGNLVPDWWLWKYFGTTDLTDSTLDTIGNSLSFDYTNGYDPNFITFSLWADEQAVQSSGVTVHVGVTAGTASYYSVRVDDTNFTAAGWVPYASSNVTANIGTNAGWHNVWIGLAGSPSGPKFWKKQSFCLRYGPVFVVTSPTTSVVQIGKLDISGYCEENLYALSGSISNSSGLTTLYPGVTSKAFDNYFWQWTTNYFVLRGVELQPGANVLRLTATDDANITKTTTYTLTLDYNGKPAPVLRMDWPTNVAQQNLPQNLLSPKQAGGRQRDAANSGWLFGACGSFLGPEKRL